MSTAKRAQSAGKWLAAAAGYLRALVAGHPQRVHCLMVRSRGCGGGRRRRGWGGGGVAGARRCVAPRRPAEPLTGA
eukprot:1617765-Prymnesium_polylepis.1